MIMDADILEVINDEAFNTPFLLGRSQGVRQDDGEYIENRNWQDLKAVIQPAKGYKTQHLKEGDKNKPAVNLWCSYELNPTFDGAAVTGDLIDWHQQKYQVVEVMDWSQYGYWYALAVQVIHHG